MVSGFDASSSRFRFYCDINVTLMGLRLDYYDYGIKLSFIRNKKKKGAWISNEIKNIDTNNK